MKAVVANRKLNGNAIIVLAAVAMLLVGRAHGQAEPAVPLFEGLGTFGRKVSTTSPEAQRYFDQGLCFLYAFNHDEAIRSFREAARLDPKCAMAWWGVALAHGPHINKPIVTPEAAAAAWQAITNARELLPQATPVERSLIEALSKRYVAQQPEDRSPLDQAYADAMREIYKANPADADIGALFAESLMDLRPWDLWTHDGKPQPGADEVVATLEQVLAGSPNHPLALHLYIHALEASPQVAKTNDAANRLRDLQPGLGHLVHMPSHIDIRQGRWAEAIVANDKAIAADKAYRARSPRQGFYHIYMAHNHHMLAFAAIMSGQRERAMRAITAMIEGIDPEWIKENAALADGFLAVPMKIMLRFGRWEELLAVPEPPDYLPLYRALRHFARGVAYAAMGDVPKAKAEQAAFEQARAKVPPEAAFGNNKASDLLAVADDLLAGEILYREGQVEPAIARLKRAIEREDALRYDEPPDWMHPTRHALGAILLAENRAAEAEAVYQADLKQFPENGWSLFGLAQAQERQNKPEAAATRRRFEEVWRNADSPITSSCYCAPGR